MVSVIMPVYNGEKYIKFAIDSVLNQTLKDFEFIIVNDGSKDNTENIIKSYKDERIKYYYKKNSGPGIARNFGMSLAKGEFIAFIDSDDIYMPNKLEEQVKALTNNKSSGLLYCDIEIINHEGEHISYIKDEFRYTRKEDIRAYMLFRQIIPSPPSIMIRYECYKNGYRYGGNSFMAEDYEFFLNLSKEFEFYYLPLMLYKYRKHEFNLTNDLIKTQQLEIDVLKKYSDDDIINIVNYSNFPDLEKGLLIAKIFIKIGRYSKALEILEILKNIYNSALVWFYLGNCYYIKNDYENSIKCYTKAINLDNTMVENNNNRGCAYAKIFNHDKAKQDFEKAIDKRANYMDASYNIKIVDEPVDNYKITLRELRKNLMPYN